MSDMCGKKVFCVIYDPENDKTIKFSTHRGFGFSEAYKNVQRLRKKRDAGAVEFFSNADYSLLERVDLRTLRYNKLPTQTMVDPDNSNLVFSDGEAQVDNDLPEQPKMPNPIFNVHRNRQLPPVPPLKAPEPILAE